jgi:hypothetical protein
MINDKMRDEFEAWALEGWAEESLSRFSNGDYCGHTLNFCWLAWQASRAAVVVQLPELHTIAPDDDRKWHGCRNSTIRTCARAVEAAGLKVKS